MLGILGAFGGQGSGGNLKRKLWKILRLRLCLMYLAFGGGSVGAALDATPISIPRWGGMDSSTLVVSVVFIFLAWLVNQLFIIFPFVTITAESVASTILGLPDVTQLNPEMVTWEREVAFWN